MLKTTVHLPAKLWLGKLYSSLALLSAELLSTWPSYYYYYYYYHQKNSALYSSLQYNN